MRASQTKLARMQVYDLTQDEEHEVLQGPVLDSEVHHKPVVVRLMLLGLPIDEDVLVAPVQGSKPAAIASSSDLLGRRCDGIAL